MTTQTEALKLLVEALSLYETRTDGLVNKALAAGKEALAQPEHELVEDLQAKLKWATEQLEANINWEFVAFAKEEMLKAAWAEIKELKEQIKEPEQEPVGWLDSNDKLAEFMHKDLKAEHDKRDSSTPRAFQIPVYTTPQQPVIDKSAAIRIATALGWTPPHPDLTKVRNDTIEEIATELERFTWAFGKDTVESFTVFIRGMKDA